MIDYDNKNNHMLMACDTCGEKFEEYGDFKYCVAEARLRDWVVIKKKGGFHHYCSKNCEKPLLRRSK